MKNKLTSFFILFLVVLITSNCTEPYQIETTSFKDVLVIESTITNELDYQEIKLSRTYSLVSDEPNNESNAQVWIEDSDQNTYNFSESEPGVYVSDETFKAEPDIAYQLHITTSSGKHFESNEEYLTPVAELGSLYAEKAINNGIAGIEVRVNSNEDIGNAKHFRYEYEETYKIVAPYDIEFNIELTNINITPQYFSYDIVVTDNDYEKKVGYASESEQEILQTIITDYNNSISKFPICFIEETNHKIREKYSILVRQYVQTKESHGFYKKLKDLGSVESLLINSQPGYVNGNIYEVGSEQEKVVGFFEVSSVSEKRIFFSHYDFDLPKPDFPYFCETSICDYRDNTVYDYDPSERAVMYSLLKVETPPWELLEINYEEEIDFEGNIILIPIYTLLTPECGNCTSFSSNIKPEFWED